MFRKRSLPTQTQLIVEGITIQVTRKPIKNLNLKVNARTGEVRVSSPSRLPDEAIVNFIRSKIVWIDKHLAKKDQFTVAPEYVYVTGEQHLFRGDTYTLEVVEGVGKASVFVEDGIIKLHTKPGSDVAKRTQVLDSWYRQYLKDEIPKLISKWEPIMGVKVSEFGVKKMKTRWGTCAIRARRIWLNLELAKYAPEVLEYIVVHEMVHLLERLHNARFHAFMDQFLPDWRDREELLNKSFGLC